MSSDSPINLAAIGNRIRQFRLAMAGISTQSAFSNALSVDQQRLSGYENGTKIPHNVIATIVRLGANPYWLLFGEGQMRSNATEGERWRDLKVQAVDVSGRVGLDKGEAVLPEFYILPLYANESAIGTPPDSRDTEVECPAIIHRSWCQRPADTDCVRVTGRSMEPTIPAGAMITIDRSINEPEKIEGKIAVIGLREGGVTIIRLRRTERGCYVGLPDNPAFAPISIDAGDRIIGQVQTVFMRLA